MFFFYIPQPILATHPSLCHNGQTKSPNREAALNLLNIGKKKRFYFPHEKMSVAFSSARPRSKGEVTQQTIQKVKEKPNFALMLRFCFECGWECARPLLAQKKVTPAANIRRNGNWYVRAGRRCEGKQSQRRRVFFRSPDASFILQYRCTLEILISFGFLSPLCCVPSAVADGHF